MTSDSVPYLQFKMFSARDGSYLYMDNYLYFAGTTPSTFAMVFIRDKTSLPLAYSTLRLDISVY